MARCCVACTRATHEERRLKPSCRSQHAGGILHKGRGAMQTGGRVQSDLGVGFRSGLGEVVGEARSREE
eukprot:5471752-Alexandrium_andersonii.AAC.1